jgi:uncharacterized protein
MLQLTQGHARRFLLAYQGLLPPRHLHGKSGLLGYLRRVGCIQYDPLEVAGRNTDLVIQSRLSDYTPHLLSQIL